MAQNFQENFNTLFRPPILQPENLSINPAIMPMPMSSTPWNIQNMPWAQQQSSNLGGSNVMQFEAHTNCRPLLHVKRKSDVPEVVSPPKQFITEERITAHFNGLHISNHYGQNVNINSEQDADMNSLFNKSYDEYRVNAKELEEKLKNAKKITLCEDLKKYQEEQKKSSLLPEALMNRIEKPCTALVLWQPTPIHELLSPKTDSELKEENNKETKANGQAEDDCIEDIEFLEETDDFIDNNNTCSVDYNNFGDMDEDL